MKRVGNIYEDMITVANINSIYRKQISVNTKNKAKIYKFEQYYTMNISRIKQLLDTDYEVSRYNIFLIKDPKYRIIMSQTVSDKLINHLVGNKLIEILDSSLINTNVATRHGKGTHYGIKYLKRYLNQLKGGEIFALKFDVSKYFYNIDHDILKTMYRRKIKDERFLIFLDKIIDSTDEEYINLEIDRLVKQELMRIGNHKKVNELKKIPYYEKGKGLPIGNLTSQILAVFYLNELDHYVVEKLKVKYIRYMDDGVLLSNDKEYLLYCLKVIKEFMKKYKLTLNSKTCIINVSKNGIDFLGFRFYIKNNKLIMKVRNSTKTMFKTKMKLIYNNKIKEDKAVSVIASYKGHFKWGNCYNLFSKYNK